MEKMHHLLAHWGIVSEMKNAPYILGQWNWIYAGIIICVVNLPLLKQLIATSDGALVENACISM